MDLFLNLKWSYHALSYPVLNSQFLSLFPEVFVIRKCGIAFPQLYETFAKRPFLPNPGVRLKF